MNIETIQEKRAMIAIVATLVAAAFVSAWDSFTLPSVRPRSDLVGFSSELNSTLLLVRSDLDPT